MEEQAFNQSDPLPLAPQPAELIVLPHDSELHRRARQVGAMAGQVVARIRHLRTASQQGRHVDRLKARAANKAGEIRDRIAAQAEEWRQVVREKSAYYGRRAKESYGQARQRTDQLGRDYPWHVLLAAGIAGFVLGALLRARRASRAV